MIEYSKREGAFLPAETVYGADADALTARRPDGTMLSIPWSGVTRARLTWAPARSRRRRRLFIVHSPAGILAIDNMHYAAPRRFEARDAAFAALAAASADRIEKESAAALYLGVSPLSYAGRMMLALGALALASIAILAFAPSVGWGLTALLHAILLAAAVPAMVRWAVRARPRSADAASIRAALAPQGAPPSAPQAPKP